MQKYLNRQAAGKTLASELSAYANRTDVMVFALPRGGVPVAYEIANALHAPLDAFIVRKLGVPGHKELAMGAIATGGAQVFNEHVIATMQVTEDEIDAVITKEQKELARREQLYRGHHDMPDIQNKIIILVDDGIATGATLRVAIKSLRQYAPKKLIVAVPVADQQIANEFKMLVDEFLCPMQVETLDAVGLWYDDFSQTEDDEVVQLLKNAMKS